MSSDLESRIMQNARSVSLDLAPPISKIATVRTLRGQSLNLPEYQIPDVAANSIIRNPWYFQANGNYQTVLQTGGIQNIKIDRGSGSGKCNGRVFLRLVIQNTSGAADVQVAPAPFLINQIQFQTPGGDVIHTFSGLALWLAMISSVDFSEWQSMSDLVLATNYYDAGNILTRSSTTEVLIPLYGNVFSAGEIPTRVIQGDCQVVVNFATPASFIITGSAANLQVNALSIVMDMQQLDQSLIASIDADYRMYRHDFIYPYPRQQQFSQTFNANTQYTFQLSGITGDVVFIYFVLRSSLTGLDQIHGTPIQSFQFLNQEGIAISGAQVVTENQNRWAQLPQWALGTWMQDRRYYGWNFASKDSSLPEFLATGRKNGAYGFSGNEQIQLTTTVAGTNEVMTMTTSDTTAATGGTFSLVWTDEYGQQNTTTPLAFNATAAAIKAALEALPNFEGTVTVSTTFSAAGSVAFTFGGNLGNRPLYARGFTLNAVGCMFNATRSLGLTTAVTTPGVRGMTSGSNYFLDVIAFTSGILSISSASATDGGSPGRLRVQLAA